MESTRFDSQIQVLAKKLADGGSFLAEELRSEMHIAIMSYPSTDDYECMVTAAAAAKAYLRRRNKELDDTSASILALTERVAACEPDGIYCPYCSWINEEPENEYEHMTYHGDEEAKPYECPECSETFMVREIFTRSWEITKKGRR